MTALTTYWAKRIDSELVLVLPEIIKRRRLCFYFNKKKKRFETEFAPEAVPKNTDSLKIIKRRV